MRTIGILAAVSTLLTATGVECRAQAVDGPRAAVDQLFLGMHMGNESIVRQVLAPDVRFTVLGDDGTITAQGVDGWIRALVASQGAWDEQIYDVEVRVDGPLASVWAPYTFYLAGRLSHCGVNSIELLRGTDGWKITQIADTQRGERCPDPLGSL